MVANSLPNLDPLELNLQHVTTTNTFGFERNTLVLDQPLAIDHYCKSQAPELSGINSFILNTDQDGKTRITTFLYTVEDLHPIRVAFLKILLDFVREKFSSEPYIRFVFVIPDDMKERASLQWYEPHFLEERIEQYVLGLNMVEIWNHVANLIV